MGGTCRIDADGEIVGFGFAITPRCAITAGHVIDAVRGESVVVRSDGAPPAEVATWEINTDLDIAVLELKQEVPTFFRPAAPSRKAEWQADARWLPNDPLLTGTITISRRQVRLTTGERDVEAIQLHVQENVGNYKGYSGTPVIDEDGRVFGVLVEQVLRERFDDPGLGFNEQSAANVLYAIPISDIVSKFSLKVELTASITDSNVGHLRTLSEVNLLGVAEAHKWIPSIPFSHDTGSTVERVQFSLDGALLFTSGTDRSLRVWDVADGTLKADPLQHSAGVSDYVLSNDGHRLASRSGRHVAVWNLDALDRELWSYDASRPITDISLSPNGNLLALADGREPAIVRDLATQSQTTLDAFTSKVSFSPDGIWFATHSHSTGTRLWRMVGDHFREKSQPVPVKTPEGGSVEFMGFSRTGRWLIRVINESGQQGLQQPRIMRGRDVLRHDLAWAVSHEGFVDHVVLSIDDSLAASTCLNGTAKVWRLGGSEEPISIDDELLQPNGVAFGPGGRFIALATWGTEARILPLDESQGRPQALGHDDPVTALAVSPQGTIATASADMAIVWSTPT